VSLNQRGRLNFDAEISADGNTLWFADGTFSGSPVPDAAAIVMASRGPQGFTRVADSAAILAQVNAVGLNYAPSISRDGLELFFTRIADRANPSPEIFRAARETTAAPFGAPQRVAAISGSAEAPALSPDGSVLYYHKRENGQFSIFLVRR
jgi:WD40-like Beta Propeller Repeat